MPSFCLECGASTPAGTSCRASLDALLLLESTIPGGPGAVAHFYAVASYGLQHPETMNYTAGALAGLRTAVAEMLDGRATLDEIRHRTRRAVNGAARVTRRAGDSAVAWRRGHWPITVADVLVELDAKTYCERVLGWARSVREALDAQG